MFSVNVATSLVSLFQMTSAHQCRFLGSDVHPSMKMDFLILTSAGAPCFSSLFLCILLSSPVLPGTGT